ncbi:hypothetical protein ACLOJK_038229 [Asimina triloba]
MADEFQALKVGDTIAVPTTEETGPGDILPGMQVITLTSPPMGYDMKWLDGGGQSKGSNEVHIHSEADNLTHKYHESESQSEVQTDKQDEIVGDMGELLQCVSMLNKEIRQLKKEVRALKEVDRHHALDVSVLRRNQVIIAFIMGVIVVVICYAILMHIMIWIVGGVVIIKHNTVSDLKSAKISGFLQCIENVVYGSSILQSLGQRYRAYEGRLIKGQIECPKWLG